MLLSLFTASAFPEEEIWHNGYDIMKNQIVSSVSPEATHMQNLYWIFCLFLFTFVTLTVHIGTLLSH